MIDESLCGVKNLACSIYTKKGTQYGLENVAISKFGSKIFINMIALGRILRYIGINIMLINIKDFLPSNTASTSGMMSKMGTALIPRKRLSLIFLLPIFSSLLLAAHFSRI